MTEHPPRARGASRSSRRVSTVRVRQHPPGLALAAVLVLIPGAAWASHAEPPQALKQQRDDVNGAAIPPGTVMPSGTQVWLTATAPSTTNSTGTYEIELEVREVGQAFQNVPTHSAGVFVGNKPVAPMEFAGISFEPQEGVWKWQARMKTSGSPSLSSWVTFNAGNAAFTIEAPQQADILVDAVTVALAQNPPPNTLELEVTALLRNRGLTATGPFAWRVWLSTSPSLGSGAQLLWTSTNPVSLAAAVPGTPATQTVQSGAISVPKPAAGAYYVLVEADPPAQAGCTQACGEVPEFDEENNVRATADAFIRGVDLVAEEISNGPASAQPGSQVTFTVKLSNRGIDPVLDAAGVLLPVTFRIVASRSGKPPLQTIYENSIPLGAQTQHALTVPVVLPPGVQGGEVTWGLVVDPRNQVVEVLETNNMVFSAAETTVAQADLEVTAIELIDSVTLQPIRFGDFGGAAKFRVTVRNAGTFASIPTHLGFVLSRDNNPSLIADHGFENVPFPPLSAGQTVTQDVVVTVPVHERGSMTPLSNGDFHFFAAADWMTAIWEVDEGNNFSPAVGPVRLRAPQQDYAVLQVRAPGAAAAGDVVPLGRRIANVGTAAGQPAGYACYASVNAIVTEQDYALPFVDVLGGGPDELRRSVKLAAGAVDDRTEWVRLPGHIPAGSYHLGCIVDPDGALSELSRTNNAAMAMNPVPVAGQAFSVVTASVPDAPLGQPYHVSLVTTGALGPVTWEPAIVAPGLALNASGELTGMAQEQGVFSFRAVARTGGREAVRILSVRALPTGSQLELTTQNLPPVLNDVATPYVSQLSAVGGVRPYRWSIVSGTLPNGLALDAASGVLGGTPKPGVPNGETALTVRVADAVGGEVTRTIRLRVVPKGALVVGTVTVPEGMVGTPYITDFSPQTAGAVPLASPVGWSVAEGRLPDGLTLENHPNGLYGILSGTPARAGHFPFVVQAKDAFGRSATVAYILTVHSHAVRVSLAEAPGVLQPGEEVTLQLVGSGAGTHRFRLFSGTLPEGLEVSADGRIHGTISTDAPDGDYAVAFEGVDAVGAKGLAAFVLEVRRAPVPDTCSATGGGSLSLLALALMGLLLFRRPFSGRP